MSAKIAVVGTVNGNLKAVFTKLATLHAKNNFSFALVVGELFGTAETEAQANELAELLNGSIEVPLTTYFALGRQALPPTVIDRLKKDGEACPNLFPLGRRTIIKTSDGIRIVSIGGSYSDAPDIKSTDLDEYEPVYTEYDTKILKGAATADIFVTSEWPKGVTQGSQINRQADDSAKEQQPIADICSALKPRYHFSSSDSFYEREPFFHARPEDSEGYLTTRFISLAPYGNTTKQKWIYAFSLDTKATLPATVPTGTTASPLTSTWRDKKRKADDQPAPYSRFDAGNGTGGRPGRGKRNKGPPPGPQECFFCLSSANAAAHLVTSIGEHAYLTTAKGPLPVPSTFPALGLPGHMLIIPLEHAACAAAMTDGAARAATLAEMRRYRRAMQGMVARRGGKGADGLGSVAWEIGRAGGVHFHQQFMPIGRDVVAKGLVEAAFKVSAENESYPRFEAGVEVGSEDGVEGEGEEGQDYFRVFISGDAGKERQMTLFLDSSFRFDLQFGRKVLAKLLGLEARMDWRNCGQTQAEEEGDAEAFKAAFKDFDFTLSDE